MSRALSDENAEINVYLDYLDLQVHPLAYPMSFLAASSPIEFSSAEPNLDPVQVQVSRILSLRAKHYLPSLVSLQRTPNITHQLINFPPPPSLIPLSRGVSQDAPSHSLLFVASHSFLSCPKCCQGYRYSFILCSSLSPSRATTINMLRQAAQSGPRPTIVTRRQ
jgi:hypothetical protein